MDWPQLSKFGKTPSGRRLELIKESPNYKNGQFQNINLTPNFTDGGTVFKILKEFIWRKNKRIKPFDIIPSKKTNLHELDAERNVLIWFGHSSYFIQIDGKKIVVDPVLSGAASPIKSTTRSFNGTEVYTTNDIPEIDFLFLSHDHWDHLDYETLLKLKAKTKKIITGLGTGEHLELWGFDKDSIIEKDWNEEINLGDGFVVNTTSARHFSGRLFKRNKALWMSFVLKTPTMKIFIGGDSGYDTHFKEIGGKFGPFDLVILECGQYNKYWKHIHKMPEEVIRAAEDLKAKKVIPVHWAKFSLALHDWDDPIKRVVAEAKRRNVELLHPMIGEEVDLKSDSQSFTEWWKTIR